MLTQGASCDQYDFAQYDFQVLQGSASELKMNIMTASLLQELSEEMHAVSPNPKRRTGSQVWYQGLTGEPAPPAIDSYVRELANCGHITEADMRMYLCLWTELNEEQRRMAREAVTAARDEGDVAGGADHVRLVVSHNEMQYGRPALVNMVNELMGAFDDGCRGGTAGTAGNASKNCSGNGEGGLIMA
jgi:hypothetical protein